MNVLRRQFLRMTAGAAVLPAAGRFARAQTYPARPVRIIVGFAPAGTQDIFARLIGEWLSKGFGQTFVVENRPGAGGNIATELVVKAPADGHTLLLVASSAAINASLYEKLNFNFMRDIAPVAGISRAPLVMLVHPSIPAHTVPEFIAFAKSNPGKLNFASPGAGSVPHIAGELFKTMAGIDIQHVPYRGGATGAYRSARWPGADDVQQLADPRSHQSRPAACFGRHHDNTLECAPRPSDGERVSAGLRGKQLAGDWRSQEHAVRDHRRAQSRDQRRPW